MYICVYICRSVYLHLYPCSWVRGLGRIWKTVIFGCAFDGVILDVRGEIYIRGGLDIDADTPPRSKAQPENHSFPNAP